jgi:hypothetical protein
MFKKIRNWNVDAIPQCNLIYFSKAIQEADAILNDE